MYFHSPYLKGQKLRQEKLRSVKMGETRKNEDFNMFKYFWLHPVDSADFLNVKNSVHYVMDKK